MKLIVTIIGLMLPAFWAGALLLCSAGCSSTFGEVLDTVAPGLRMIVAENARAYFFAVTPEDRQAVMAQVKQEAMLLPIGVLLGTAPDDLVGVDPSAESMAWATRNLEGSSLDPREYALRHDLLARMIEAVVTAAEAQASAAAEEAEALAEDAVALADAAEAAVSE